MLVVDDETQEIRAGLVEIKSKQSITLSVGETVEGIELVSANYEEEEVILRKGAEMAIMKFDTGEITALSPEEQKRIKRPTAPTRTRRRRAPAPEPKPKEGPPVLTGEALEQHLQEYQMEIIRQGLPPLPIPLTEEQEDQLIEEGILEPLE